MADPDRCSGRMARSTVNGSGRWAAEGITVVMRQLNFPAIKLGCRRWNRTISLPVISRLLAGEPCDKNYGARQQT